MVLNRCAFTLTLLSLSSDIQTIRVPFLCFILSLKLHRTTLAVSSSCETCSVGHRDCIRWPMKQVSLQHATFIGKFTLRHWVSIESERGEEVSYIQWKFSLKRSLVLQRTFVFVSKSIFIFSWAFDRTFFYPFSTRQTFSYIQTYITSR